MIAGNDITVTVTTKGRYFSTLPLCLMSVINQTLKPKRVILVDDNEKKEYQQLGVSKALSFLFKQNGIEFDYFHGQSKGQVYAQQIALEKVDTNWVFKLDDDNILQNNVLQRLAMINTKDVGARSCLILTKDDLNRENFDTEGHFNRIEDIFHSFNIQMIAKQTPHTKPVEHLHGCYLFLKEATDGYPLELSPAGHREDTVFTHSIFRKGYKLLVDPTAIIWHLKEEKGGNRTQTNDKKNELIFIEKLKEWGVIPNKLSIVYSADNVYAENNKGERFLVPLLCKNIRTV